LSASLFTAECAAVLFDLDGVLVDSSAVIEASWRRWAQSRGVDEAALLPLVHGRPATETLALAAPHLAVDRELAALVRQELENEGATRPYPGAAELVGSLPAGCWAVVTSAPRVLARGRLRRLGRGLPEVLVCAEDVGAGKPSPEGFLLAAERLRVPPAQCVVVEDSLPGVAAGLAAGMRVVALATTRPPAELGAASCVAEDVAAISARISARVVHLRVRALAGAA